MKSPKIPTEWKKTPLESKKPPLQEPDRAEPTKPEEDDEALRAQLRDAIRECERQIDILRTPSRFSGSTNQPEINLLESELQRLRDALAELS